MPSKSWSSYSQSNTSAAGAAIYTRPLLAIYDLAVLGLSNRFVWRCPSKHILQWYNAHISGNHLDIGVGTGYFLDHCQYPIAHPSLTLLDLNPNSLVWAAARLQRYQPVTVLADILAPLPFRDKQFDSIGMNYLLHCLPGTMSAKAVVFRDLLPLLGEGGRVFGTTIVGQGLPHNRLARFLLQLYNRRRIFSNIADTLSELELIIGTHFRSYTTSVCGSVAFFAAEI